MSNEITSSVQPAESPIVAKEGGNIACTALVPAEMSSCQTALIAWCAEKIESMRAEAAELRESFQHAKERKWKTGTLKKHAELAADRVTFYEKMLSALHHGFVIVPNFPVSVFAIRTEKTAPLGHSILIKAKDYKPEFEQEAQPLTEGKGKYQNPFPYVADYYGGRDDKGQDWRRAYPSAWDQFEFPVTMAKPEIMRAADRAMALKVFDQIGILPAETMTAKRAKGDPIIVGQLLDPRGRVVTFMIAWHLDTRAL